MIFPYVTWAQRTVHGSKEKISVKDEMKEPLEETADVMWLRPMCKAQRGDELVVVVDQRG